MVIEILGARMLAPYVGTSHFVWTAQIAVTMVALATGYYTGGWLVDRSPRLGRLYGCIIFAALYLCLTVLGVKPITYFFLKLPLALAALLSSVVLFFVPLSLLAMVAPYFIRVITVSVGSVGGTVGRLTAISTLGSLLGTILIGYVLIPFLPNSLTMYLTAALLLAVSIAFFIGWAKKQVTAAVVVSVVALAIGYFGFYRSLHPHWVAMEELARRNSDFGLLLVLQEREGSRRYYLNDYLTQDIYDALHKQSAAMFTYMLHGLARVYTQQTKDVLCIGLGVGIVPMQFADEGARVDVVEINPSVVPIARDFFDCRPDRLNITIGDGRYFVNEASRRYDTIILDAFLGDSSPSHLMSREAFASMRQILKPGGTLVINSFGWFEPGRDFYMASLEKTLKAVFTSVVIHQSGNGNVFFVASDRPALQMVRQPDFSNVPSYCRGSVEAAFDGVVETDPAHGIVVTDDYNPIEFYDAANREHMRRQLALSARFL